MADFFKLGMNKLWMDYDEAADVLYVSFRRPQQATDSRMEGDLIYHYRGEELVGVTILHAKGAYCQPGRCIERDGLSQTAAEVHRISSHFSRACRGRHDGGLRGWDNNAKALRQRLRRRGIRPQIPTRVWKSRQPRGRPINTDVPRFQAERTCAWFQHTYRRLGVRWERIAACFNAFLAMAMMHLWIHKLIVG